MKTWNTNTGKYEDYKAPKIHIGEDKTDKSKYRPNVSKLNDMIGNAQPIDTSCYEFKDGKDNGERQYILRSPKADITEKQEYIKNVLAKGEASKKEMGDAFNKIAEAEAMAEAEATTKTETSAE